MQVIIFTHIFAYQDMMLKFGILETQIFKADTVKEMKMKKN